MLVACYHIFSLSGDYNSKELCLWDIVRSNKEHRFFNIEDEENGVVRFYTILDSSYNDYLKLKTPGKRKYKRFKIILKKELVKKEETDIKIRTDFDDDNDCSNYIGIYFTRNNSFKTMNMNMDLAENLIQYLDKSLWL